MTRQNAANENEAIALNAAEVGVTGSPNSVTDIHFDVRADHLQTPLLGSLLALDVPVNAAHERETLMVLGQVASLETLNRWHEDPSLKNFIKLRGRLPHLTEIGDITTGTLQIVGAYRSVAQAAGITYTKTRLPVPPGTGLAIRQVTGALVRAVMSNDFGYAYLGQFYGSTNVPAPIYVRHFGDFQNGGTGEAYMGGVFGPSGSGKSVVAATLISLWAHNPSMGVLILDPQSEFTENAFARGTAFTYDFHELLRQTSRGRFDPHQHLIALDRLMLEGTEMFVQVLCEKGWFQRLGLAATKVSEAQDIVVRFLEGCSGWNTQMTWDEVSDFVPQHQATPFRELITAAAAQSYATGSRQAKAQEFLNSWQTQPGELRRIWDETVRLFRDRDEDNRPRVALNTVLEQTVLHGQIRILDLNPETIEMSDSFKLYLIDFVFRRLRRISHIGYRENRPGNCLIVLDEAGRYIPQDPGDDDTLRSLTKKVTASVKELRKMRCGFMFVTQTIAEIQKEIFRNLHFRVYGVGLGVGADADHIRAREGDSAYELYRTLPDPRLSGTYSFMVAGVLLAMGSSGRPMVIEGFGSGQAVLDNNVHLLPVREEEPFAGFGRTVVERAIPGDPTDDDADQQPPDEDYFDPPDWLEDE